VSSPRKTNVPAIPEPKKGDLTSIDSALRATKEAIEVGYGRRGDPLDRFVTMRDLKDGGIANVSTSRTGGATISGPPGGGSGDGAPVFEPGPVDFGENDFTVPPAPTGVTGRGIPPNSIMVVWNPPNYSNHRLTEIFALLEHADGTAATIDELQANLAAAKVGEADGTVFMHRDLTNVHRDGQDGLDAALNPSVRYYWCRFKSTAGVTGPLAPLLGAPIAMSIDAGVVLDEMIANVRGTEIYGNLRNFFGSLPLDPILTAGGVLGYVNQQDGILANSIDQVEAIIGVSQPGDPSITLYQWVHQIQGQANSNSAFLNDIQTWQAALGLAAGGESSFAYYTITRYNGLPPTSAAVDFWTAPGDPSPLAAGDRFRIDCQDGAALVTARNHDFIVASVVELSAGSWRANITRGPDNTAYLPSILLTSFTGLNANTRVAISDSTNTSFIDFIATVQHNIFVSVDPDTAIGRELTLVRAQIGDVYAETQVLNQVVVTLAGQLENIWSVRMQQNANGLIYSAGFGLGMTTDTNTGESLSTFIINANQFAVMGPTGPGVQIVGYHRISASLADFTVASDSHGLFVAPGTGQPDPAGPYRVTLTIPEGNNLRTPDPDNEGQFIELGNPLSSLSGKEFLVRVITPLGSGLPVIRLERVDTTFNMPSLNSTSFYMDPTNAAWDIDQVRIFNYAMFPPDNIPFIVDTVRNVVGIRGRLVVNGLIVADAGQFTTLTAQTAFVQQLQAEVVNANVVIGQRLIAGTPGTGALTPASYNAISNYIIEMNNPITNQYPLRYWKPSSGHMAFGLDQNANIFIGGNMSVGGNATIATTDVAGQTSASVLFSVGGLGQDAAKYAMWIGPKGSYGTNGNGRNEANALFFIKENGRAGFNSSLFLGSGALALPSVAVQSEADPNPGASVTVNTGAHTIRANSVVQLAVSRNSLLIRADRDGQAAPTYVTVSGFMVNGGTLGGGNNKFFKVRCELTPNSTGTGSVTGGLVQEFYQDDYAPECFPFTMSNVIQVPAGNYYVKIEVTTLDEFTAPMSIIRGWNCFAMQVGA
jgi:hypothetical protein